MPSWAKWATSLLVAVGLISIGWRFTPLLMTLALFPLYTTQVISAPWVWALPFLLTFIGGVFADLLESRQRKLFIALSVAILVTQAALCWTSLAGLTL